MLLVHWTRRKAYYESGLSSLISIVQPIGKRHFKKLANAFNLILIPFGRLDSKLTMVQLASIAFAVLRSTTYFHATELQSFFSFPEASMDLLLEGQKDKEKDFCRVFVTTLLMFWRRQIVKAQWYRLNFGRRRLRPTIRIVNRNFFGICWIPRSSFAKIRI